MLGKKESGCSASLFRIRLNSSAELGPEFTIDYSVPNNQLLGDMLYKSILTASARSEIDFNQDHRRRHVASRKIRRRVRRPDDQ